MTSSAWQLLALLMAGASAALAAPTPSFVVDVWTTEEGLPQNEIKSILQTQDGYLWLGTPSGLVRFDGIRFTVYDESNTPGMENSNVEVLFEDSRHTLWVGGARTGVFLFKDGRATPLNLGQNGRTGLAGICEDPHGAVWVYLANGQLWRCQNGTTNLFVLEQPQATDYRSLIAERSGPLWIGTDWQLSALDWQSANATAAPITQAISVGKLDYLLAGRQGGFWRLAGRVQKWRVGQDRPELDFGFYPWGFTSGWKLARLNTACEDREGNLIVGTVGAGLYWFDAAGKATQISTNQGLSNDYILSLHVDREGDLWVGTDGGGLNRVKPAVFDVLEPSRGLVVQSVAADPSDGLWIGYSASPLAHWKDGTQRNAPMSVRAVLVDRQERVWAGTRGAGLLEVQNLRQSLRFNKVPGFDYETLQNVSVLHEDRRGWLWVGGTRGVAKWDGQEWKTFGTAEGLSGEPVRAIMDDPKGAVWIGTAGGGLNRWHQGQFTSIRKAQGRLPSDNISALCVDREGVLWVGTEGAGLARLHQGNWTRYTREDGLAGNSIGYIIEDDLGFLWLGSNAGLMRVARHALNDFARGATNVVPCRIYGRPDGLPIRECSSGTQPGPSRTADGTLWFPTIQGLVSINPANLKPNPNPPPVRIESVLVDGQPQLGLGTGTQPGTISIPPGKEHLEIHYTSLNLAAPQLARFKYRLEGLDKEWVEAGDSRVARYPKLPFARYRFHVIACNEDGIWNETGATLALAVTPPFWRTAWFLSLAAATLLGGVAGVVHYLSTQRLQRQLARLKQQEALEKERSRIARDIHDQLGANLTQVALLGELVESDKAMPEEVEQHARQISQTARDTTRVLDEIVWAVNPANDTIDGLMTYLCKSAQEYLTVAGLQCRFEVPAQLPATPVPPEVRHNVFLACKEAVTNVVRHAQASAVWVRLRFSGGNLVLEIQDNGKGLAGIDEKSAQRRNGLRNMRNRMEEIGGEFGFAPAPGGGALVRLTVPINQRETR
ncbi:MAG: two-component regulator propeller domain-containing protein [Verrucomicrobiia bacterium]